MDELEALNMLLRLIGSSPVNSLDTPHPDAANAKTTLDRIRKQVQRNSWWFNTDYNVTLEPDNNGFIKIPSTYRSVTFTDNTLIKRGDLVYNRVTQSSKHTTSVEAYLVVQVLSWDDMPAVVQEYCAYTAGSQFIRDEIEDVSKANDVKEDAQRAWVDMNNEHLRESNFNVFNRSKVVQARGGVRPYHRAVRFQKQV